MMDRILEQKRQDLKQFRPPKTDRKKPVLDLAASLKRHPFICEVKRRSPSKGDFPTTDPLCRAVQYESAGAGAISVLTDEPFFGGSFDDLVGVSSVVSLPVLCKDFVISPVQIEAAYRCGADAVLLIAAALTDSQMTGLAEAARARQLSILFEIHEPDELDRVLPLNPRIVGINTRNLNTMEVDITRVEQMLPRIPAGIVKVAESGIGTPDDVKRLRSVGADAFLVGSALMATDHPGPVIRSFRNALEESEEQPCS